MNDLDTDDGRIWLSHDDGCPCTPCVRFGALADRRRRALLGGGVS